MKNFVSKEVIEKGWSGDKKYHVTDENGTHYLLRISGDDTYDAKLGEFNMMKKMEDLGIPMCRPIEFGVCLTLSINSFIYFGFGSGIPPPKFTS